MAYNFTQTGQQIQTILNKSENTDNKVTSITSTSTHTQYPSAKCMYDKYVESAQMVDQAIATAIATRVEKASGTPSVFKLGKDSSGIYIELAD